MGAPALVVMAAGMGSRYGGLKQMDPFGPQGETLLDYAVYDAVRSGFEDIVFVVRQDFAEAFRTRIEATLGPHCRVQYAFQQLNQIPDRHRVPPGRSKPWGTAHAVLASKDLITGSFGVINADDFYGRESFEILFSFLSGLDIANDELRMGLVGYSLRNTLTEHGHVSRGVCRVSDGQLQEIVERKKIMRRGNAVCYESSTHQWCPLDPATVVSMNMWGFPKQMMEVLDARLADFFDSKGTDLATAEFLLPDVVGDLIADRGVSVAVLPTEAPWFGVTYPEDQPHVVASIRRLTTAGEYPVPLWAPGSSADQSQLPYESSH